jgi:hypothetical protein
MPSMAARILIQHRPFLEPVIVLDSQILRHTNAYLKMQFNSRPCLQQPFMPSRGVDEWQTRDCSRLKLVSIGVRCRLLILAPEGCVGISQCCLNAVSVPHLDSIWPRSISTKHRALDRANPGCRELGGPISPYNIVCRAHP